MINDSIGAHPDSRAGLAHWHHFVALDLRTLTPHLKTIMLTIGALVILVAIPAATVPAVQMVIALGLVMMIPSHLFSVDERAGLDLLYGLLPIRRRTVVIGRYTTILLTVVISATVGTVAACAIATLKQLPVEGIGVSTCYLVAAMLILQAIQMPLFFTLGYAKARIINTLLLFATAIGFFGLLTVIMPGVVTETAAGQSLTAAVALTGGMVCFASSLMVSIRLYSNREF
ncbi:ABC-2 transporter permease [Microbacterium lacticum]